MDVPKEILGQLGLKIQHALRAFTAIDRKNIKLTAENYPISEYYKTEELLTSLGIGEAAVTVLSEKGAPTPLSAVLLRAPMSRMGILTSDELDNVISRSKLRTKYNEEIDRESAYEILTKKIQSIEEYEEKVVTRSQTSSKQEKSALEEIMNHSMTKQIGRTILRELTRGLLGALGVNKSSGRRSRY
jgi:hypothetical protein